MNSVNKTLYIPLYGKTLVSRKGLFLTDKYIDELRGAEKAIFKKLYAGKFAKTLYRLYEYRKG